MGVKKSTVWTSACVAEILYTPASSAVSKPTSTFGSCCRANFPSTVSSAAGLSLLAQPAALTCSVSRIGFASAMEVILKHVVCSNWQVYSYTCGDGATGDFLFNKLGLHMGI